MSSPKLRRPLYAAAFLTAVTFPIAAHATLPAWLQHIVGASTIESALYRAMQLPSVQTLYPRPPKEAATELSKLIVSTPNQADLYQLRARADEDSLNPSAAESDWKLYVAHAPDTVAAKLELADFYQRRLLVPEEIATLRDVALAPPLPAEAFTNPSSQRSWLAFERILGAIDQQGLPPAQTSATFADFLTRYPDQPAVYAANLQFQLDQKDWSAAEALISRYTQRLPQDAVFPIRARALLEFRRGNLDAALAVYDHAFQPLWPAELTQSYLALLDQTHRQRAFVAAAREQLVAHPDGPEALNALARIVAYQQQSGSNGSALQTIDAFRTDREARNAPWSPTDLSTLAALARSLQDFPEVARYDYALASTPGTLPSGEPAAQAGLAGLIDVLLSAPEQGQAQPLAIGSQNLTLYRDIATLDQGPGYWNGILSLWLNGTSPASEYASETARAQTYFHRSKAAELLSNLDRRFPSASERPALHAALIHTLAQYGEPDNVIAAGKEFLAAFPAAPERLDVANLVADAYARQNDTASEFALYESQLNELSAKTSGLPLTSAASAPTPPPAPGTVGFYVQVQDPESVDANAGPSRKLQSQPLAELPTRKSIPEANAYAAVLDRYLGRLTSTGNLPRALTVLRAQLDHNPNDPLLYERLASFLEQNNLSAQQEQLFQQASTKFQDASWTDKLARLYLREKKREAFANLLRQVTDTFSGTDLDSFFSVVSPGQPIGPQLSLQLNLYAAKRFPHDLVFTHNLLAAYQAPVTRDPAAYESLLRSHWWASDDLRDQFLAYLSSTHKLDTELAALQALNPSKNADTNPAAARELAELHIFSSHFEQAAPLLASVADLYPADPDTGDRAVSLYRSLAYLDPTPASTQRAVALETNLLAAAPDNPDRLATLGDLFAEATSTGGENLTAAAPFWHRIPKLHPGSAQGFLTSSTIFWDYFQFDAALAEITSARTRFNAPNLFGFEAGAIQENRHNLPAAIDEYTSAVIHPIDVTRHFDTALGTIAAWLKPPSDTADSNLRSTAQSFFGSEESNARLLQLAIRPSTRALVDSATSKAVAANPSNTAALTLRADILSAQHHAPDLAPLLTSLFNQALDHTSTLDEAAAIGSLAEARSLTPVYERALAKQAALTPDPVQKIELQYSLARSLESHNDIPAATSIIASVYTANPRILGVVRSTTDFYLRTNRAPRAISTLLEAAKVATASLARDFTLEAASRANDANDTAQARSLALNLLAQTPYDARVLDVLATSYARAHDDAGLRQFYLDQLDAARSAPNLTPDMRKQDIALLRRGLIPALTRLSDFPGATAQYIALISAFPEDTSLANEAALYTLKHSCQPQLLDFLNTTVQQSPRDSRFMVLLAQTQTTFGNLPAAEAAYSLAINIRKDRVDLYTSRADLEIRLSQSDPHQSDLAAADFERLYVLTYHDPSWMVRAAEVRARQQRPADAVHDLQVAYIDGHAKSAADDFTIADQLARWNLLPEARTFADQAVALAGPELLTPHNADTYPQPTPGAVIYARILTRLGLAPQAISTLNAARHDAEVAATSPSVLAAELARENISDDEAAAFRQNFATRQRQAADQTLNASLSALGQTVQTFYTPEQKQALALELDKLHAPTQSASIRSAALLVATSAGLSDREAEWRKQTILNGPVAQADTATYIALQNQRLQFSDLAHTLEAYAARLTPKGRSAILTQAALAYNSTGDYANELRLTRPLALHENTQLRDRFFSLLLHHNGSALPALASSSDVALADAALNYTVAHASQTLALTAVHNRAQTLPAVWSDASTALVQTYFATTTTTPIDTSAFDRALATNLTLADRLSSHPDPKTQLTGDIFFAYAATYGIFLSTVPHSPTTPDPEDFLPASLEANPSSTTAYLTLARTYAESHNLPAALNEYRHALELSPSDAAIEDEISLTLSVAKRPGDALTHWHAALAILADMQQHAIYPESWFTDLETVTLHLGERHLTPTFRPEIESILIPYLAKNGTYRSNELLHAIFNASATPDEGARFVIAVSASAPDPNQILSDLRNAPWLPTSALEPILLREIALTSSGPNPDPSAALRYRLQLIDLYLAENHVAQAQAAFDAIPKTASSETTAKYRILLAVRSNRLQPLIDTWHANPDSAPLPAITAALTTLLQPTSSYKPHLPVIRPLQEFAFDLKRQNAALTSTDYLALAQLRLDTSDLSGTLELLHQLTLLPTATSSPSDVYAVPDTTPANPYAYTDQAAALLEHAHHPAEAIPFLNSLVASVPWDPSYRLRLAQAQLASNANEAAQTNFVLVARNHSALYDLRLQAARALAPLTSTPLDLGTQELTFLTHPSTPAAARQPYANEARIAAAALPSTTPAEREALLREAIAIAPSAPTTNRARVDLTLLQSTTADPAIPLAIFASLQSTPATSSSSEEAEDAPSDNTGTSIRGAANTSPRDVLIPAAYLPPSANALDVPTQIRLATLLSSAHQRNGTLESALAFAQLALDLASRDNASPPPDLLHRRDDLRQAILLARGNALRRPTLHPDLAQTLQVRPRLTPALLQELPQ
jgi:hypothetical protein